MSSSTFHVAARQPSDNEVPLIEPVLGSKANYHSMAYSSVNDDEIRPAGSAAETTRQRPSTNSSATSQPHKSTPLILWVLVNAAKFIAYCLAHVAAFPFIGSMYMYGALKLRKYHEMTPDVSDWIAMLIVGGFTQLAVFGPIYCLAQPKFLHWEQAPVADWWGSVIFYCVSAFVLERVAITFYDKTQRRRGEIKRMARLAAAGGAVSRRRFERVEGEIRALRQAARLRSTYLLVAIALLSGIEVALIRIAGRSINIPKTHEHEAERMYEFYTIMSIFWFLILFAMNTVVSLGILVLVYQMRLVGVFGAQKRAEDLMDIRDSELVARWCAIWQGIIMRDVQSSPSAKSISLHGSAFSLLTTLATAWYLALRFLYPNSTKNVEDFHSAALLILAYAFLSTLAYIFVTVWMQRAIEAQHRTVATMHHQLVCAIDDARAGRVTRDDDDLELLAGKTRVVYSLDRLLATADPRARLFNSSLDSLRWTGVNFGLLFVNAFIVQIFYERCSLLSGGSGGAQ